MSVFQHSEGTLIAPSSRTATFTSSDLPTGGAHFLNVILDLTANAGGSGSVTVTINGKDQASGKYYLILSSAALTSVATTRLKVGPNITATTNTIAQDYLPETIQIVVTANNANPVTYSVGYSLT